MSAVEICALAIGSSLSVIGSILLVIGSRIASSLDTLGIGVAELNMKMATIVARVDAHEGRIERLEDHDRPL